MIKQHSQEWHKAKQSKIGGSEIFSLCLEYCKKELAQIGIEKETSFKTALEIFLEKKFDVKPDPISQVCSEFGLGMEDYIINRLNSENNNFVATGSKDFIINEALHPMAACSPDGFVDAKEDFIDYDKKPVKNIICEGERLYNVPYPASEGVLEVKTTQFTFNYEAKAGAKWQYLFQLNYNMLVSNCEWGMLACLTPKEKEFDNDFFKGKILGKINLAKYLDYEIDYEYEYYEDEYEILNETRKDIDKYYNLYTYTYKANKTIQNICKLALERFQNAMNDNKVPDLSKNQEKLMREKKMLARMYPEKYGKLQANQELNELLNERGIVNNQLKIDETAKEEVNCKLILAMGHHIELEGFNYIAKFDKRGSLRVSQNKDSDVTQGMINKLLEDVEIPNYMAA